MAVVRIQHSDITLRNHESVAAHLASIGIYYERWEFSRSVEPGIPSESLLSVFQQEIHCLKARRGYQAADVIDVDPSTPGLEAMLSKFNREHWHEDDEVRFVVDGRGLFHIRPQDGPVTVLEVEAGDLICVPRGTWHWFDLCADRRIRAIRLFQNASGWTPYYTGSGVDKNCQPVCLGPAHIPLQKDLRRT